MKSLALLAASLLALPALVTPVYATAVADEGSYMQHQLDCLALMFKDPQAHATECGGPFLNLPPPETDVNKSGKCVEIGDIGTDTILVAAIPCCHASSLNAPLSWDELLMPAIVRDDSTMVAYPIDPCGPL